MAKAIDQKTYLEKYLAGPSDKKKKKKKVVKGKGLRIIDDDLDLSKLRPLDSEEFELMGEDAPQIAGVIDERPEELKRMEQYNTSSKWKVISQDDGFTSNLQIEEIKNSIDKTEESIPVFGKMYSDSEDEGKNDSDLSPPRKIDQKAKSNGVDERMSKDPNKERRDDDLSPPRQNTHKSSKPKTVDKPSSGNDFSPQRRSRKKSPENSKSKKEDNDSDLSPPRKKDDHKRREKVRKPSRWGSAEPRKRSVDSDRSPSRKSKKRTKRQGRSEDSDQSPPRRIRRESPPRRRPEEDSRTMTSRNKNDSHRKRRNSSDSDLSPPRRSKKESVTKRKDQSSDSDLSPPRKRQNISPQRPTSSNRQERPMSTKNRHQNERNLPDRWKDNDSPPPSNKKMAKTLDGKQAGLQDARRLRDENEAFKRREDAVFRNMSEDVSGRNAKTVSRKMGKRDTSEDRLKKIEAEQKKKELEAKYKKWGQGLKQVEDQEQRAKDYVHESAKPLARYSNDGDLEHNLRGQERAGDPMLDYMRGKKRETGDLMPEKPTYKGNYPPNRFNIRPGYRWDGVDRTNGYEKKYFDNKSKKKALEEEAYKWSTEDL